LNEWIALLEVEASLNGLRRPGVPHAGRFVSTRRRRALARAAKPTCRRLTLALAELGRRDRAASALAAAAEASEDRGGGMQA
jgi:hypothetical protein